MFSTPIRRRVSALIAALVLLLSPVLFAAPYGDTAVVTGDAADAAGSTSAPTTGVTVPAAGFPVKIATYNIAHARGKETGGLDEVAKYKFLDGIADLLKQEKVEVVGFTEISGGRNLRAKFRDQPQYLAKKLGFHHCYGENVKKGWFGILATQGNVIMSKYPILSWKNHKLYRSDPKHEQRACVEALLDLGKERRLRVFCAHLSTQKEESTKQVDELWGLIKNCKEPVILMGDFNLRPTHEAIIKLSKLMKDTTANLKTSHRGGTNVKIDYHFTLNGITPGLAYNRGEKEGYSDHLCVINQYWLK
ncbi:MAG TPA: endonuclease/exonuclease/phosphatase family protein [Candidatus Ozemobacteraceae bacterium]|nr:endonuclease/exonuclease/phosphatase family protein [Candidatus Ozemobacteraceae bacterium]